MAEDNYHKHPANAVGVIFLNSCTSSLRSIQRKRTHLFFGYEHRFEAYVPKEKRVFGYFALPVLVGHDIVAALDLKTDRRSRKLLLQKWNWVGNGAQRGARKDLKRRIEQELHRFERFQLAE